MSKIRYRATMPRDLPNEGMAHVVVGIKKPDGWRFEFSGQVPEDVAVKLMMETPQFDSLKNKLED